MGRSKHDLEGSDGRTMLAMAFDTAHQVGQRVLISGPSDLMPELPHVLDERVDAGPVAGIEATLKSGNDECYLFMPCDMPGLNPDVLRHLVDGLDQASAAIFEHSDDRGRAVLPLVLRTSTLTHLQTVIQSGARSIHHFLEDLDVNEVPLKGDKCSILININNPSEWNDYLQSMISE
tara:strand:+ start:3175 stop:3705 length:531 start_codon:yes stop_codon:yes gene_type:complete